MGLDFDGNDWMDLGNNWAGVSCLVKPDDCPTTGIIKNISSLCAANHFSPLYFSDSKLYSDVELQP